MGDNTLNEFLDELFQDSRDTNSVVFRVQYPTEELADDISVYQPLEFAHECTKLKQRLLSSIKDTSGYAVSAKSLLRELTRIGKVWPIIWNSIPTQPIRY